MNYKEKSSSGGAGFLLTVVFIVLLILKVLGLANVSWWVVFAPCMIDVVIVAVVLTVAFVLYNR